MKAILQAVQNRISEIQQIKTVDEDLNQLDTDRTNPSVKMPCCLIDIEEADFQDLGQDKKLIPNQRQEADIKIILRIATINTTNSSKNTPISQKQKAWQIYDLIELVHQKVHGWNPIPQGTGKMSRVKFRSERNDSGIREKTVEYRLSVVNC